VLVMRPVRLEDLNQLVELTSMTSFGLTSLPKDRELLRKKVLLSMRSFEHMPEAPGGEQYLLVMEDTDNALLAGTSGIVAKTGGFAPFYAYRVEKEVRHSAMLNVRKELTMLHRVMEHDGPCEVCSLFLRPSYRLGGNGRLLSLSRFLLMAEFPQQFDPMVIAEMRGVIDERGHSAFWDAVGRHFFDIDFPDADYMSIVNKQFIADLLPPHPICVDLLPAAAQAVVAQVHDRTRPALRMLERESFTYGQMVDIFEAGPIVQCELRNIRSVKESRQMRVGELLGSRAGRDGGPYIISNVQRDFRACLGEVEQMDNETIRIHEEVAEALGVKVGNTVRYVTVRPTVEATESP